MGLLGILSEGSEFPCLLAVVALVVLAIVFVPGSPVLWQGLAFFGVVFTGSRIARKIGQKISG